MNYEVSSPLQWPPGRDRAERRALGAFRTEWPEAVSAVQEELRRLLGAECAGTLVVSTDRAEDDPFPTDPGVVAYFECHGGVYAVSCDRWSIPDHNAKAIALVLSCIRGACRHGALDVGASLLRGFRADAPALSTWRAVLEFPDHVQVTKPMLDQRRRALLLNRHPDRPGGSTEDAARINAAYDVALREIELWK